MPKVLTLDHALELFRTRGLDLLIADAAVLSAQGDELTAAAIPNPALNTNFGRLFNYSSAPPCAGCSIYSFGTGLSDQTAVEDTLSGKRALRRSGCASPAPRSRPHGWAAPMPNVPWAFR